MIAEAILNLLRVLALNFDWAISIKEFVENKSTFLLSEQRGTYRCDELLKELNIRKENAKTSNITVIGISELISVLKDVEGKENVFNYVFKSDDKTAIIYMNEGEDRVFGALLVT
jgi:hypothetical protein